MVKITHIVHSGFLVELTHSVLIFDWYTGELPVFDGSKTIYVFVSHKHADHYGTCIWTLAKRYPRVEYILFHDIDRIAGAQIAAVERQDGADSQAASVTCARHTDKHALHRVQLVEAHKSYEIGDIHVETLLSTDEGVAFYIEAEGHTFYHAGDLNMWYWEGEPEADNRWQIGTYRTEIDRLRGKHIEFAFLPLDPRQEQDAPRGIEYFMQAVGCDYLFPMHYWNRQKEAMAYLSDARLKPYAEKFHFEPVFETECGNQSHCI